MRIATIASLICTPLDDVIKRNSARARLLPPWLDNDDAFVLDAFRQTDALKRQRDGLTELFPNKKAEHDQQFNELVMELAAAVHEYMDPMSDPQP